MQLDKSLITNLLAFALVLLGLLVSGPWQPHVLNTGLYALSGAITNWLAIHMLFEKVPGFYGSGVIPLRFEEFKAGIRRLIMEQFFNKSNLDRFFQSATEISDRLEAELTASLARLDMDAVFDSLVDAILQSSFGGMLGMFGGRSKLDGLREPFTSRMRDYFEDLFGGTAFRNHLQDAVRNSVESEAVLGKLEAMIDHRLEQMTPQLVKEIIQSMIREHLGWLVIWGGVVGGAVGLAVTLIGNW
ncbi:MAG: hypothetical protein RLZZ385_1721 [Pseudomonadota bacterium]|jgi:uncharacterized membrane-anchored protein YjiN (DUF445 family)